MPLQAHSAHCDDAAALAHANDGVVALIADVYVACLFEGRVAGPVRVFGLDPNLPAPVGKAFLDDVFLDRILSI